MFPRVLAAAVEHGWARGALARGIARAWSSWQDAQLGSDLPIPTDLAVVAVGGATLGGSGKTPVACAVAAALGEGTALVGHGYGGRLAVGTWGVGDEPVGIVGDEALVGAHALRGTGARVSVGPSRSAALANAIEGGARRVVFDSLFLEHPRPRALRLLAIDPRMPPPLGPPPTGDARASLRALLGVTDAVVWVDEASSVDRRAWLRALEAAAPRSKVVEAAGGPDAWSVVRRMTGVVGAREIIPFRALSDRRLGVVTRMARPARLLRSLEAHGLTPSAVVHAGDHARPGFLAGRAARVDLWLATGKCAAGLPPRWRGRDVAVLEEALTCSRSLLEKLLVWKSS